MRKRYIASAVISPFLGIWLLGMSAPSCGCEEPWMDFVYVFSTEVSSNYDNLDGKVLTEKARIHLLGKPLSKLNFPTEIQPTSCIKNNDQVFDCEFWFLSGPIRDGGFHVKLVADSSGLIKQAEVTNLYKWFGSWRVTN